MRNLETEINTLFELCEQANLAFKSIDAKTQQEIMYKVQKQSNAVFQLLEMIVNPMGKKDFLKELPNRNTILRLYFLILKSLYLFSINGASKFEDERCIGSTTLAYKLIRDLDFEHKFGYGHTWINNDLIYVHGIMYGMRGVHPTLLQNIVRCLTQTLRYPEIKEQKVPDYMDRFEKYIMYYLVKCKPEERIYLDFI